MIEQLYWREPWWLLAALYPLLLLGWRQRRSRRVLDAYAERALQPWVRVGHQPGGALSWRAAAMGLCWVLLSIALAGPRLPLQSPSQAQTAPGQLVALIDLSRSMSAGDVPPSRRAHAIALLRGWLAQQPRPAIGLVLYAGRAHAYLPPTRDRRILDQYLQQLAQIELPTLGNDLAGALQIGRAWSQDNAPARLLLLSDGDLDSQARRRAEQQVAQLAAAGVEMDVIGIGGAGAVPLRDLDGEWLLADGQPVLSALQSDWLAQLAASAGGRYLHAQADAVPALDEVWRLRPVRIPAGLQSQVLWHELFPWLLVPATLLLTLLLLGPLPVRRSAVLLLLLPALPWLADPAQASDAARRAYQALQAGDYAAAREHYGRVDGYAGRFGEGVSCYRLAAFDCARVAFAEAAWLATNTQARGRAAFNLANSRFQLGDYDRAIALYEDVIRQGVVIEQARSNLNFTRELQAEVKRLAGERSQTPRRPANGPRSGNSGMPSPPEGGLQLAKRRPSALPGSGPGGVADYQQLLQRGLERLQLRSTGDGDASRRSYNRWAAREDLAASVPGARIWQRLFEIDEGFPAPLQQPLPRPGERPW